MQNKLREKQGCLKSIIANIDELVVFKFNVPRELDIAVIKNAGRTIRDECKRLKVSKDEKEAITWLK